MKKIFLPFILTIFPTLSFGINDSCMENGKYAKDFTIDKRCYVTDEQKRKSPFNATVALVRDNNDIYCTGTIVKFDDKMYLATAKHCIDPDQDGVLDGNLTIQLQDGRQLLVDDLRNVGNYDTKQDTNHKGDWAFYKLKEQDVPFVLRTNKKTGSIGRIQALKENLVNKGLKEVANNFNAAKRFDVYLVGYGALEIMSDTAIKVFKQRYTEVLSENNIKDSSFNKTQSIDPYNDAFKEVLLDKQFYSEWITMFSNDKLKVSDCSYSATGTEINCQGWSGNSGGPIFDKDNNIIGIHTRGARVISEDPKTHAHSGDNVSLMTTAGVKVGKYKVIIK